MLYLIIAAITFSIGWVVAFRDTKQREQTLRSKERAHKEQIEREEKERAAHHAAIDQKKENLKTFHLAQQQELLRLIGQMKDLKNELNTGFLGGRNWLANAYSEFIATRDTEVECSLVIKSNPAWKAAETVSHLAAKRREMAYELKRLQYQVASYEEYFPFLVDYRDAILDELVDLRCGDTEELENIDPALGLGYISNDEYKTLSNTEKFQLALDRYWLKKKSNLEIGRLYERYIGYLYEIDG